jgi:hypothetical protein
MLATPRIWHKVKKIVTLLQTLPEFTLSCLRRRGWQPMTDGSSLTKYKTGNYLMTDDNAPVELLGMQVIDELIQDEVSYYKNIYDENGISGVFEMLK